MKNRTAMAAMIIVQVQVVEQQARVEVEDNDCTSEEALEDLVVVLRCVVEQIEDNHEMLIQNYSGLEMQEYTQYLHSSLRQHQDLPDDL